MRRICSFTDFFCSWICLRLPGAGIFTDYLLLKAIQPRIGANAIRVRFATEFFLHGFIGLMRMLRSLGGTVFQTAVTICSINPETSSRVTLASLGIGFQPKLVTIISC